MVRGLGRASSRRGDHGAAASLGPDGESRVALADAASAEDAVADVAAAEEPAAKQRRSSRRSGRTQEKEKNEDLAASHGTFSLAEPHKSCFLFGWLLGFGQTHTKYIQAGLL